MISDILKGNNLGYPDMEINFKIVYMRDAAKVNIKAMFDPASASQRINSTDTYFNLSQVSKHITLGYNPTFI
jgi:hypothetical protein